MDRRTLFKATLLSTLAEQGGAPAQPVATGADIGTLYPEIMKLTGGYPLSFLEGDYTDFGTCRDAIRERVFDLFHYEPAPVSPNAEVVERWDREDHIQERVVFSTSPELRIPAYVLIPKGHAGPRPGIVDLHSHGGMYMFGKEKVMPMPEGDHPAIEEYRQRNYEGRSTSLELCRRGYVVISIDAFYFGERRTVYDDMAAETPASRDDYTLEQVQRFNRRASQGERTLIKSLFWAGATWQGIVHWDDIRTVDYLVTRPEVDPERIGCLGISMGGDRTDYLAGLDERIRCAVSVGWMSTLKEMVKAHVATHSLVHFLPGMAHYLDLPDLIACMAPKPLLLQYCSRDGLYPMDGMRKSDEKLAAIYRKAGAPDSYDGRFYDVPHTFSREMQEEAFDWLDQRLKP